MKKAKKAKEAKAEGKTEVKRRNPDVPPEGQPSPTTVMVTNREQLLSAIFVSLPESLLL